MKIHDLEFLGRRRAGRFARTDAIVAGGMTTASGLEGWGESSLGWRIGELAPRRKALLAVLAGRSVFDIEELHT